MLAALKHSGESFSQLFVRLASPARESQRDRLLSMAGIGKDWVEADEIFQEILKRRSDRRGTVV
jgi:hypothetical protein